MQVGMIGLGRMGGNMVRRLMKGGHACVVFHKSSASVKPFVEAGAVGTTDLKEFVSRLEACAKADPAADPRTLEAALQMGLQAFLESLP